MQLREEFQAEEREDVLQIQTMLWYSWLAVSQALVSKSQEDYIEPATFSEMIFFTPEVRTQ